MESHNKKIGNYGEDKAASYLKLKGYEILSRNFRSGRGGEIDIIAKDRKGVLVFVEVKTRTNNSMGDPADAVNYHKKKHIINTALKYIHKNISWLEDNLKAKNLSVKDIFYCFYKNNKLFIIKKTEVI